MRLSSLHAGAMPEIASSFRCFGMTSPRSSFQVIVAYEVNRRLLFTGDALEHAGDDAGNMRAVSELVRKRRVH